MATHFKRDPATVQRKGFALRKGVNTHNPARVNGAPTPCRRNCPPPDALAK